MRSALSHQMFRVPLAARRPAVINSESPGRKKPTSNPVSANTMAKRTPYPPHWISESSEYAPRARSRRNSNGALLAPRDGADGAVRDGGLTALDPHAVERAPDEHGREQEEHQAEHPAEPRTAGGGQAHRQLDGEEAEEGGELDDGVHGHRRGVLERIAHGVADDGGGMQRAALLLQLGLDDLLGVVPGAARVGHEHRLVEAEERDRDQVADEEVGLEEREGQRGEEDREEDVEH